MARATPELILALRSTAARLERGAPFQWTHQGACICGNLAQTVTRLSRAEIHRLAIQSAGDWGQHAVDYCPTSGYPIDHVLESLLELGLEQNDIFHLERLDDRRVLRRLPAEDRNLDKRDRGHAVRYMREFAALLEEELFASKGIVIDPNAAFEPEPTPRRRRELVD